MTKFMIYKRYANRLSYNMLGEVKKMNVLSIQPKMFTQATSFKGEEAQKHEMPKEVAADKVPVSKMGPTYFATMVNTSVPIFYTKSRESLVQKAECLGRDSKLVTATSIKLANEAKKEYKEIQAIVDEAAKDGYPDMIGDDGSIKMFSYNEEGEPCLLEEFDPQGNLIRSSKLIEQTIVDDRCPHSFNIVEKPIKSKVVTMVESTEKFDLEKGTSSQIRFLKGTPVGITQGIIRGEDGEKISASSEYRYIRGNITNYRCFIDFNPATKEDCAAETMEFDDGELESAHVGKTEFIYRDGTPIRMKVNDSVKI